MIAPEQLLAAYRQGFFPMGHPETGRLHWLCPDPRAIIELDDFHLSRTVARKLRARRHPVTFDEAYPQVVEACADRARTWLTPELRKTYCELRRRGTAHSAETWHEGELAGGVYGVSIGAAFMAESMFHHRTDAGMEALAALVGRLRQRGFALLDVQFTTPHLLRLGATELPRVEYLRRLAAAVARPCPW